MQTYDGRVHVAGRSTTNRQSVVRHGHILGPPKKQRGRQQFQAAIMTKRPTGKAPLTRDLEMQREGHLTKAKGRPQPRGKPRRSGGSPNTQITDKQRPSLRG